MHGQGNYNIQVGQDPYARPPLFQQNPATTAPTTSPHGPFTSQPQVIQQAYPSFHPRSGAIAYQHVTTSDIHQGQPAPVISGGMSSSQPYMHHPGPPHTSNQIAHYYPYTDQQPLPWSRNIHQLPPPPPLQGQSAYRLPPPPPLPPHSSSSNLLTSDPCASFVIPVREHSHQQSTAPVLPPPPPLPPSSPSLPPLPPPSPSSDILPKTEGNDSWKGLRNGENLELKCSPFRKPPDYGNVPQFQHTDSGTKVGSEDAEAAHSLTDSDMDMEDDISYPEEEKKNCLSVNSNDEWGSMPQEDYTGEKLQPVQHTGGHRLSEILLGGNISSTETSEAKAKGGGPGIASDCKFPELGITGNGQDEISFHVSIKESHSQNNLFGQPGKPVLHPERGYGELPDQLMNDADPIKSFQGHSSNSSSENEDENHGDVGLPSINDVTTKSDAEKGHDYGIDLSHKNLSESNTEFLPESMTGSSINVIEADELAIPTGVVAELSDRSHRGKKSVSSSSHIACHSKNSSRNNEGTIAIMEPTAHKPDIKSDKLNVDEFGRLVRKDVSDSDISESPPHARRHARRTRKRSRSQSKSRSPHDRRSRRRRSPWRRNERRGYSRSFSPRRSRSRSPVLRRDTKFSGDKLRREKGQLPGCFDFLRGKCYRGETCRYSHHESDKSERSRYNRGKHYNWDASPTLRSPDFDEEGKVPTEKEMGDKGRRIFQDRHDLRDTSDAKGLLIDSTSQSPDKIDKTSSYPAHDTLLSRHDYVIPESAANYSGRTPEVVDQEGKRTDDSLPSESSSYTELLARIPTRHPADRQDLTSPLYSAENHLKKPCSNLEVPCWSLNPLIANHPSQLSIPLPSTSQSVSASFAPPILQNYNSNPHTSQNHLTPERYPTYEAAGTYQHSHLHGTLKSVSSSLLPPPPPPQPPPAPAQYITSSQHMQQSLLPPSSDMYSYTSVRNQQTGMPNRSQISGYQSYFAREHDQMLHRTDGTGPSSLHVSHLTSREGDQCITDEGHVQGISSSKSLAQSQTNPLLRQSPYKEMNSSIGAGLSSDTNSSYGHPYFKQASYGLQHYTGGDVYSKPTEPGMVSSSASRFTQGFNERNRSYVHGFVGSKISDHFNPYASTLDLPPSSKFSSNTLVRENDAIANSTYGTTVGLSSTPVNSHRIRGVGSKNMFSSSSVLPAEFVSRPGGNQYDPLFDSIEQKSNSSSKTDHLKHEITGDSDDVQRFHGSERLLNTETIKQDGGTTVSANDSTEKEECGETADVAIGDVLNSSPSNPIDATDVNAGELEIDQVKSSGKKKKSKEKSIKLFQISIAGFVKEVLKPSWRQGNMSKEAFKTIVKKTVDKVSGALKSHRIPKSQAKINHYIDSSRGKLTKLVMGYVDKYVKV